MNKEEEYQRLRKNLKALRYKLKNIDRVTNWRRKTKRLLVKYKGGKCQRCGYDKDIPVAYDFHHTDPTTKEFTIAGSTRSMESLKREVDKCELLCKICHAIEHVDNGIMNRQEHIDSLTKRIADTTDAMEALKNRV